MKILLVAYFYPPCSDTGAHRPASMAKYLRRLGHEVTVLTTRAYGGGAEDEADVVRSTDAQLWRARANGKSTVDSLFDSDTHTSHPHPLSLVIVPEPLLAAWAPFALWRGLRLLRKNKFDVVISTSPVESTHFVGRALARIGRAAWVADIRDAWTFEPLRPRFPTRFQRWLDRQFERRWLGAADGVVCVSRPAAADLKQRLNIDAAVVHNGADPEMLEDDEAAVERARELLDPARVSLVYTGRFGSYGRDPSALVAAIESLAVNSPELAEEFELVVAGPLTTDEHRLMTSAKVGPARIVIAGSLSRADALALQRAADVLLLVANSSRSQLANFKLFEYLAAGRPILALAEGTEAGQIVSETGGEQVAADDPVAIEAAFGRLISGKLKAPGEEFSRHYSYPAVAARMAAVVAEAVDRADAQDPGSMRTKTK